jgi:hypothetical protein
MNSVADLLKGKEIKMKKAKHQSEYGDLCTYFHSLGLKDKMGKAVSIGYVGMLCAPLIRGEKGFRNYTLLYELKAKCEKAKSPRAVAWSFLKPRKRLPPNPALPQGR